MGVAEAPLCNIPTLRRLAAGWLPSQRKHWLSSGLNSKTEWPWQRMDIGLTRFGVEEVVEMRHHRHG